MEEILNAKLEEIAKQKEQIIAQLNAALGAEQVIKEILESIRKEKKTEN